MARKRPMRSLVTALALSFAAPAFSFAAFPPATAAASSVRGGAFPASILKRRGGETVRHSAPPAEEAAAETSSSSDGETFEFQAEVSRVMDIIINSLYQDKDVFLRELVSNAADACDKRRFLSLTDGKAADQLTVRIQADKEANTLTISDEGVGMTKDELVNNLGRIAQSGTKKFMEALGGSNDDVNLIGQFGVGFYSGYLVADKMTVASKSAQAPDSKQYVWESQAGSSFTVKEDTEGTQIEGSGTRITLHLKEDCDEYTDEFKLRDMLRRYSSFIQFPIELWAEKTEYEQVPDTDAPADEGADGEEGDEGDEPKEPKEPKMKTVSKTVTDWELVNSQKPIWLRSPKEVNATEYAEFYKSTFKAYDEPTAHTHFSLEGQVEFKALLYVPSVVPFELNRDMFNENSKAVKLYVKRVFINDKFEELMPRWLTFVRGIVDSEDLPLNVGREILQKSKMLSVINKRLVRKSIDMFKDIESKGEEDYLTFWNNFGKYLKVGIIEDNDNKDELAKLLRFWSTKSAGSSDKQSVSLQGYVDSMKANQTQIFYVSGDGKAAAARSPVLEKLKALDYEVLYLTEPLDELMVQSVDEFAGHRLVDAAKGNLDIPEEEESKEAAAEAKKDLEDVCDWLKDSLKAKGVSAVEISTRLTDSAATLVQGAYGVSPTMQRYMKAQAVASGQEDLLGGFGSMNQVTLEINPTHPIIERLKGMVDTKPDDNDTKAFGTLLYDVAAIATGYSIEDPAEFASRITALMSSSTGGFSTAAASSSSSASSEPSEPEAKPQEVTAEVVEEES